MADLVPPNEEKEETWKRFVKIFSAKLVLEVFGGGGAIWGFSEVLTLRNPETQEYWRFNALVMAAIFAVRWVLQMWDFTKGKREPAASPGRLLQIFSAKLVLEVFGGGGAIWGFSEALTLRNPVTQECWRYFASFVAAIFLIRFFCQMNDYVFDMYSDKCYVDVRGPGYIRMWQIFSAKLVLEVFGGGGAIWGFAEVCTLRNPKTQEEWRYIALTVGFIFFIRYLMQLSDFLLETNGIAPTVTKDPTVRFRQIFAAKMVLEVFGGGGAIWGFSEACAMRNPTTNHWWRVTAAAVGAVFFIRFCIQSSEYQIEHKTSSYDKNASKDEKSPLMKV